MAWEYQGEVTLGRGGTIDLMPVDTDFFRALLWYPEYFNGYVSYLGLIRWFDDADVGGQSIESEVASRSVWTNATQWNLNNEGVRGRLLFYAPQAGPEAIWIKFAKWVP